MIAKEAVIAGVSDCVSWWVRQRRLKLEEELDETMSVNPFLLPFLFDYHDLKNFDQLAELMIAGHLMTGHATGFGKLIDEKILPKVFGSLKLDKAYRAANEPFIKSVFNEIDHLIVRENGSKELLSLKAGRWTIQLTMAVQLNAAFNEIVTKHGDPFDKIVVGVFYGSLDGLTDKYDILRGINRGANHNVIDITKNVTVVAGAAFWSWLNDGAKETQEWVMEGILDALKKEKIQETAKALLDKFKKAVISKYDSELKQGEKLDWLKFLKKING